MNFFMNVVLFLTRGELLYECSSISYVEGVNFFMNVVLFLTRGELLYECSSISYEG